MKSELTIRSLPRDAVRESVPFRVGYALDVLPSSPASTTNPAAFPSAAPGAGSEGLGDLIGINGEGSGGERYVIQLIHPRPLSAILSADAGVAGFGGSAFASSAPAPLPVSIPSPVPAGPRTPTQRTMGGGGREGTTEPKTPGSPTGTPQRGTFSWSDLNSLNSPALGSPITKSPALGLAGGALGQGTPRVASPVQLQQDEVVELEEPLYPSPVVAIPPSSGADSSTMGGVRWIGSSIIVPRLSPKAGNGEEGALRLEFEVDFVALGKGLQKLAGAESGGIRLVDRVSRRVVGEWVRLGEVIVY